MLRLLTLLTDAEIMPCESITCDNGGTCVSEDPFSYECLCPPDFTGSYCEQDIDECQAVVCQNGGTCVTGAPLTFECVCAVGYTGAVCELQCGPGSVCNSTSGKFT